MKAQDHLHAPESLKESLKKNIKELIWNRFGFLKFLVYLRRNLVSFKSYSSMMKRFKDNKRVIVLEFPRCGWHWVGLILMEYLDCSIRGEVSVEIMKKSYEGFFNNNFTKKGYVIIPTHNPYFAREKVVYLLRDVRDVYVSKYFWDFKGKREFFYKTELKEKDLANKELFKEFLRYHLLDISGTGNFFYLKKKVEKHKDNLLVVHYEDLHKDTYKEIARILDYYNVSIDKERLTKIIEKEKFENKLKRVKKKKNKGLINVMRKGKIGDWKNYFNDESLEMINSFLDA